MSKEKAMEIKKLFEEFDKDHSGFLDPQEMRAVLVACIEKGIIAKDTKVEDLIKMADKDGDGDIGLIEFAEVMGFKEDIESYRSLFEKVDVDGNGYVDQHELKAVLEAAGVENPKREVEKMLRKAMKRRGDVLNFDEFVALMLFNSPLRKRSSLVKVEPLSEEAIEELKRAFQRYDVDQSGYIDKKELKNLMKKEQNYVPTSQELKAIMKRVDTNGDGKLSLPEFIEMMGFRQEVQLYWQAFMRVDINENGRIDKDELVLVLKELGVNKPKTEAKRVMKMYGKKKSLNFDNFVYVLLSY